MCRSLNHGRGVQESSPQQSLAADSSRQTRRQCRAASKHYRLEHGSDIIREMSSICFNSMTHLLPKGNGETRLRLQKAPIFRQTASPSLPCSRLALSPRLCFSRVSESQWGAHLRPATLQNFEQTNTTLCSLDPADPAVQVKHASTAPSHLSDGNKSE